MVDEVVFIDGGKVLKSQSVVARARFYRFSVCLIYRLETE